MSDDNKLKLAIEKTRLRAEQRAFKLLVEDHCLGDVLRAAENWERLTKFAPGTKFERQDHDDSCLCDDVDSDKYCEPVCGEDCDQQWVISDDSGCSSGTDPEQVIKEWTES